MADSWFGLMARFMNFDYRSFVGDGFASPQFFCCGCRLSTGLAIGQIVIGYFRAGSPRLRRLDDEWLECEDDGWLECEGDGVVIE